MKTIDDWLNRPDGLAERLRLLRRKAGLTGTRMASDLGWAQSKISKIETGKQMPTEVDIRAWAGACRARPAVTADLMALLVEAQSIHREWRQQVRLGLSPIQRNYDDLARRATTIRNFEVIYIPGLLQTADYARARAVESIRMHGGDPEEVEAATALRMQRQQVLYDMSKRFEFVVTEAALHLLLCPRAAMLGQLDRLLAINGLAHIKLGIIPFGVELPTAPQNSFILFDDLAVVETFVGETMHHDAEAAGYSSTMDSLATEAQYDADCRQIILRAMDAHSRPESVDPPGESTLRGAADVADRHG